MRKTLRTDNIVNVIIKYYMRNLLSDSRIKLKSVNIIMFNEYDRITVVIKHLSHTVRHHILLFKIMNLPATTIGLKIVNECNHFEIYWIFFELKTVQIIF